MSKVHELKKELMQFIARKDSGIAKNDLQKLSKTFTHALYRLSKLPEVNQNPTLWDRCIQEFHSRLWQLMKNDPRVSREELEVRMHWLSQDIENDFVWSASS